MTFIFDCEVFAYDWLFVFKDVDAAEEELEIDYPFIHEVIDYMESECKRVGIPFVRFKPRKSWQELYDKYGFPTRVARWCNSMYKLDAKRQLDAFTKSLGFYTVCYIGYCADEEKRFIKRTQFQTTERYPLSENGINEGYILEWTKSQPIFNHYYETNRRCGCMFCPMSSYIKLAFYRISKIIKSEDIKCHIKQKHLKKNLRL